MRIALVWPAAEFSTWDVARGVRGALTRQGHAVRDYRLYSRMKYHAEALGARSENLDLLSRVASENVLIEAMRHRADLVLIVSAMGLHPDAIWLLRKASVRTIVLFTESPYNDVQQQEFCDVYPQMMGFCNERTSTTWGYVPHAYDPEVHRPWNGQPARHPPCDVLFLGTLWPERIRLLEQIDWTGIRLRLLGTWCAPPTPSESSLGQYYEENSVVRNVDAPALFASASIVLNPFRAHPTAESLGPRNYELAACEAFTLSDYRPELDDVFGRGAMPTFTDAASLEMQIRQWLARPQARREITTAARVRVQPHTFDDRVRRVLAAVGG